MVTIRSVKIFDFLCFMKRCQEWHGGFDQAEKRIRNEDDSRQVYNDVCLSRGDREIKATRYKRDATATNDTDQAQAQQSAGQDESDELRKRRRKRLNLVIAGLHMASNDHEFMRQRVEDFFIKYLRVNVTVAKVTRTGHQSCIVRLTKMLDKLVILNHKQGLMRQGVCVFIDTDMTARERMIQDMIIQRAERERSRGAYVGVGHLRISINNKVWVWDDRKNYLVQEIDGKIENEKELNDTAEILERQKRLNNVVLAGVTFAEEEDEPLREEVRNFFYKTLSVSTDIVKATKLSHDAYVIQVSKFTHKLQILRKKRRMSTVSKTIRIYSDFTANEKMVQRRIEAVANEARKTGHAVRAGYMKVYIDSVPWHWDDETQELVKRQYGKSKTDRKTKLYKEIQERDERKHNVIVTGVSVKVCDQDELRRTFETLFANHLKVITTVQNVQQKKMRVYIVEFENLYHKIAVLKHKSHMFYMGLGISVYADETRREREVSAYMSNEQFRLQQMGERCRTLYRALLVNGVKLVWSDAQQKLIPMRDPLMEDLEKIAPLRPEKNQTVAYWERKRNVIIYGIYIESEDEEDLKSRLESFFVNVLCVVTKINNVTKLSNVMFLVKVDSINTKAEILENRWRLNDQHIYIKDDMSTIEQGILQKIDTIADYQRRMGNAVTVGYMRLFVNNKKWTWNDEKDGLIIQEPLNLKINRMLIPNTY